MIYSFPTARASDLGGRSPPFLVGGGRPSGRAVRYYTCVREVPSRGGRGDAADEASGVAIPAAVGKGAQPPTPHRGGKPGGTIGALSALGGRRGACGQVRRFCLDGSAGLRLISLRSSLPIRL